MKTKTNCKNEIAINNNFDSFKKAIRYTFNRELLQSEEAFINKIVDEAMQLYAESVAKDFKVWCCEQVIAGRNVVQLWDEYVNSNGSTLSHKF
jgi:hypothetical protein